jgi:DNA polymerase III delta prime subunit
MQATNTNQNPASVAARFINQTQRHVFLTGKAGTGKTTFLRHIVRSTFKNTVIVAPTGIAAINAGGQTIHSLFQLPFGAFIPVNTGIPNDARARFNTPQTLLREMQLNKYKRKILMELELLIIDEVSMLRADLLDAIDTVLRSVRRAAHLPFGGVQMLFIGDLLQLPPVVKEGEWVVLREHYKSAFFFDAQVLRNIPPLYIELDKIYRQSDETFITVLNHLRDNEVTATDIEILNRYYKPGFRAEPKDNFIQLTTHNYKADEINREALKQLSGKIFSFEAEIDGEFQESAFPNEKNLELKKDAQVMFLKNDPSGQQNFFNGKIGKVTGFGDDEIQVYFEEENRSVWVSHYTWENIRYTVNPSTNAIEEKVAGKFKQFPLKLAWAITVHKSQGLTFQRAILDIGQAFAPGQVYVALSRLTSLDGLILSSPINFQSLGKDDQVHAYSQTRSDTNALDDLLLHEGKQFAAEYTCRCFNLSSLAHAIQQHLETYTEAEHRPVRSKYFDWARKMQTDFQEFHPVADKFMNQVRQIAATSGDDYKTMLHKRIVSAKDYFNPLLRKLISIIRQQIDLLKDKKKVKEYLTDLTELDTIVLKHIQQMQKAETMLTALINNKEPEKTELYKPVKQESVYIAETVDTDPVYEKQKSKTKSKTEKKATADKKAKIDTKQLTLNLYREGKSRAEIALERKIHINTIEMHLAHFVAKGELDASEFVPQDKLEIIQAAARDLNTAFLTPIREKLGDEYTYSEIRFALAGMWVET